MDIEMVRAGVDALVATWAPQRAERLARQGLNPDDFRALHRAGLTLAGVPVAMGGLWQSAETSLRGIGDLLRRVATVDPSLALVCSMHPGVLSFWLLEPGPAPADADAWQAQRRRLFALAKEGHWFGTISSEPGGGGDIMATKTTAERGPDGGWSITGDKHMGSGSGVTGFMVTIAVPEGEPMPDVFLLDTRDPVWDGSTGTRLVRAWDGHGMAATQSHAFRFEGMPAERHAHGSVLEMAPRAMPIAYYGFTSVIMGVLDAALAEGRQRMEPRKAKLGAFERVSWTEAVNAVWLARQAYEAMSRAMEAGRPNPDVVRGKLAIAELAEAAMLSMSKALGGSSFSRSGPFGQWTQDVRALGFLRPPWPLAHDRLFEDSFAD